MTGSRQKFLFKHIFFIALSLSFLLHRCSVLCAQDSSALQELMKQAQQLYDAGSFAQAEERCKEILSIEPDFYHAYNLLAYMCARTEGGEEEALQYLIKSLEIKPDQVTNYTNISSLYNRLGKIQESLPYLEKGLQYSPDNFQLNYNAGLVYLLFKQDPERAIIFLNKALTEGADNDRLLYLTGIAYLLTKQKVVALQFVTELRRIGNEFLAWELENSIRRAEEGETINIQEVVKNYSAQPAAKKTQKVPGSAVIVENEKPKDKEEAAPSQAQVEIGGEDRSRVSGGGKIQIRTIYRPKIQ